MFVPLFHPARMSLEDLLEFPSAKWLFLRFSRRVVQVVPSLIVGVAARWDLWYGWLGSNTGCWISSSRRRGYHTCGGQTGAMMIRVLCFCLTFCRHLPTREKAVAPLWPLSHTPGCALCPRSSVSTSLGNVVVQEVQPVLMLSSVH